MSAGRRIGDWWKGVVARTTALGRGGRAAGGGGGRGPGTSRGEDPLLFATAMQEAEAHLRGGFEDVHTSLQQIRTIASDSEGKLSRSFSGLQAQTKRQNEIIQQLVQAVHRATNGDGDGNTGFQAFATTTNELLEFFVAQVVQTSHDSVMMVHQIDNMAEQMKRIVTVVDSVRQIAHQTRLLALNAAIEARKAGEAGRSFLVVADEVRHLADHSQRLSSEIAGLVHDTEAVIESNKEVAAEMASKDMTFALDSKGRVEEMFDYVHSVNAEVESELGRAKEVAAEIEGSVGAAVTGLQFDDLITQLVEHVAELVEGGAETASALLRDHAQAALDTRPGSDFEESVLEFLRSRSEQRRKLTAGKAKSVSQETMQVGEIELF